MAKNVFTDLYEQADGDNSFVIEILDLMLSTIPSEVKAMDKYLKAKKIENIRKIAHRMKSSVQYGGSAKLLKLLDTIEMKKLTAKELETSLSQLKQLIDELLALVQTERKKLQ